VEQRPRGVYAMGTENSVWGSFFGEVGDGWMGRETERLVVQTIGRPMIGGMSTSMDDEVDMRRQK
jgi:hypothetical protein